MQSIFHSGFLLFHFGLGSRADFDDGDAARELGQAFLEFFFVVVRGGLVDLDTDLLDSGFDIGALAFAFNDRGVVLVDHDAAGLAEGFEFQIFKLETKVFRNESTAGQSRDVGHHGFPAIAEARGLDGAASEGAAQFVQCQSGQSFAFDVLSDDQEGLAGLDDLLQNGQQVVHGADLLFIYENVGVLQNALHLIRIGDEIRGEVAFVELHAFHDVQGGLDAFGFLDGDGAVFADFLHSVGDRLADLAVAVGGNGRDLLDLFLFVNGLGESSQFVDDGGDSLVDAALDADGVGAGGHVLQAFLVDGFG